MKPPTHRTRATTTKKKKKSKSKKAESIELHLNSLPDQNAANGNSTSAALINERPIPFSGPSPSAVSPTNPQLKADALQSLECAIAEALRSGAHSEDVSRVFNEAALRFRGRKRTGRRCYFVLLVCAISFSMVRIRSYAQRFLETNLHGSNSFGKQQLHQAPKGDLLKTAIAQYDTKAISELLLNLTRFNFPVNKTEYPCPLDAFLHGLCQKRNGGTVCIFPGGILKKIRKKYLDRELRGLELLNDNRYFPETHFVDRNCSYVIQENVDVPPARGNRWCANYTYYKQFYAGAFKIFNKNNIIPNDLNTCCNTMVNGDKIRIIDFGKYDFDRPPKEVRLENKEIFKDILIDVKHEIEKGRGDC